MNAHVKPSLLSDEIARDALAKCRAILAGDELTGEQLALADWWERLGRIKQRAFFVMAGVRFGATGKQWMELPEKQRAALILAIDAIAKSAREIEATLKQVRLQAREKLEQESRRVMRPRVSAAA